MRVLFGRGGLFLGGRWGGGGGFTLVELLVVVAVIGVLAGLLLPVFGKAKSKACRVKCVSNMRQVGLGFLMYADDCGGCLPPTAHVTLDTNRVWISRLRPYVGNSDEVRLCPKDPMREARRENGGTSYLLNDIVAVPRVDPFGEMLAPALGLDALEEPAGTVLLFEAADDFGPSIYVDHIHGRGWLVGGWASVIEDIQPDRHRSGRAALDRSRGWANYLFADGHVESIEASEVRRQIESGVNLAELPELRFKEVALGE